jgi:hypothetical protein
LVNALAITASYPSAAYRTSGSTLLGVETEEVVDAAGALHPASVRAARARTPPVANRDLRVMTVRLLLRDVRARM